MADKIKIVLIDDEADVCIYMKSILEKTGQFEVTATNNPLQAEALIQQVMPRLILMDIVMPAKSGIEIITALTKDKALKRIPIIVVSGKGEMVFNKQKSIFNWTPNNPLAVKARQAIPLARGAEAMAEAYGVQDYIAKPFTPEVLIQVVTDVLERFKPVEDDSSAFDGGV